MASCRAGSKLRAGHQALSTGARPRTRSECVIAKSSPHSSCQPHQKRHSAPGVQARLDYDTLDWAIMVLAQVVHGAPGRSPVVVEIEQGTPVHFTTVQQPRTRLPLPGPAQPHPRSEADTMQQRAYTSAHPGDGIGPETTRRASGARSHGIWIHVGCPERRSSCRLTWRARYCPTRSSTRSARMASL